MRKSVIAVAAVIVLAVAAVAAVPVLERYAAERVRISIERDGVTKVGDVDVSLFDRRITLRNLNSTGAVELAVGRWEASGLAWPVSELLLRARTPLSGFRWGDPLRAERVELQGLRLVDRAAASSLSLDWLAIDGVDLARFDARYDGAYQFQVLVARAMAALSMRRVEERNVVFALPGTDDTFRMASVVVERYERGRIASLTMVGVEAAERVGQAPLYSVADVKAGGIDLRRMIVGMSLDTWYPGAPVGRIHLETASASGFAGETLKRYGVSLGGIDLATVRDGDDRIHSTLKVEGFVLAPPLRGLEGLQMRLALQTMGLKEVKVDFVCASSIDRAKGEASLDRCALVGPGLGQIDLSGRVVGANWAFWHALDDGDWLGLQDSPAALQSAQLVVTDKSLLERSLKALATVTGQPVAVTRANLAHDIRRYQPSGVLISQSMTQLLDTVARFIEQGGTLTITAKPEPPVGFDKFDYLTSPGADLVSVLGLSATLSR